MTTISDVNAYRRDGKQALLFAFAAFITTFTAVLILAGGLVTSNEAGLAVPDWPLSYGQWMPPMVGNIFWEHGHRMIAATVGLLTLLLAFSLQMLESRAWVRRLGWIAFGAVVMQGLLGGLTVLMMLPPTVSIFHACLAQTFFCILLSTTFFLSPVFEKIDDRMIAHPEKLSRLALMTFGFVYVQLILGAVIRHTPMTVIPHVVGAVLVAVHVILLTVKINQHNRKTALIRVPSLMLCALTVIQIFLGTGSFIFTRMIERDYAPPTGEVIITAAHQTIGALLLGLTVLIAVAVMTARKRPAAGA